MDKEFEELRKQKEIEELTCVSQIISNRFAGVPFADALCNSIYNVIKKKQ